MRLSMWWITALGVASLACDQPLTGPEARHAYSEAIQQREVVPEGPIVLVDGRRLAAGERLDQIDPREIVRIEIVKGGAAARMFGAEASDGVIQIFTKAAQPAEPIR